MKYIKKDSVKMFFRILTDFLQGKEEAIPMEEDTFREVCYLADIHHVTPLLYCVLRPGLDALAKEYPQQVHMLRNCYMAAVAVSVQQEMAKKELQDVFRKQGILLLFFKGAQIRSFYPVPELRTMGDMDCLIAGKDRAGAHALMKQLGYSCQSAEGDVWVYRRGPVIIEMHVRVAGNSISNQVDYARLFEDALTHGVEEEGAWYFNKEYHFCFLIYHIAKHLSSTGAGVRMFMDIAVFLNHYGETFDKEKAAVFLKEASLQTTAEAVLNLCDRWFGTELSETEGIAEDLLDELEAYILEGGIFGFQTHNIGDVYRRNGYTGTQDRAGIRYYVRLALRYLFPPADYMVRFMPALEKQIWLLPAAWFKRWLEGAFQRRKNSLATIKSMAKEDGNRGYREYCMLKKIGL